MYPRKIYRGRTTRPLVAPRMGQEGWIAPWASGVIDLEVDSVDPETGEWIPPERQYPTKAPKGIGYYLTVFFIMGTLLVLNPWFWLACFFLMIIAFAVFS